MALSATIHTFEVHIADVDRGVYEELSLRVAQHPSETEPYMLTRLLAYCLEYEEGIAFGAGGISSTEEPAVLVRDLTGSITSWIEVGAPDWQRLHSASKAAERTLIYTHRDPPKLLAAWEGKAIHQSGAIVLRSFAPGFISDAVAHLARRNRMTVSVIEGHCYLELNGEALDTEILEQSIA